MLSILEVDEPLGRVVPARRCFESADIAGIDEPLGLGLPAPSFQSVDIASSFNHGHESRPVTNNAQLDPGSFFQEVDLGNSEPSTLNRDCVSNAGQVDNAHEVQIELNTISKVLDAIEM